MGNNPSYFKGEDLPVERVSWYDAIVFCNKLSQKYKLKKYYIINREKVTFNVRANGFRLPAEAEWEYAATSKGTYKKQTDCARNKNTGELTNLGWYSENSDNRTHPVGQKQPNDLGLYDMSGNVWEWCEDKYYNSANRVLRGGSWYTDTETCCVSFRYCGPPANRNYYIGFRLVLPQ